MNLGMTVLGLGVLCLTITTWAELGWAAGVGFFGMCCIAFAVGVAFEQTYGGKP